MYPMVLFSIVTNHRWKVLQVLVMTEWVWEKQHFERQARVVKTVIRMGAAYEERLPCHGLHLS
jgi:hypothetical protein